MNENLKEIRDMEALSDSKKKTVLKYLVHKLQNLGLIKFILAEPACSPEMLS